MEREVDGRVSGFRSDCSSHPSSDAILFFLLFPGCCACWPRLRFILVSLVRMEEEQLGEECDREIIQPIDSELGWSGHVVGMAVAPGRLGGG